MKILDLDGDGVPELIVGGTAGAVRYFTSPDNPRDPWNAFVVLSYDPPADVGLLGYGDIDGDGDLDLVAVVSSEQPNDARITWIRNAVGSASPSP